MLNPLAITGGINSHTEMAWYKINLPAVADSDSNGFVRRNKTVVATLASGTTDYELHVFTPEIFASHAQNNNVAGCPWSSRVDYVDVKCELSGVSEGSWDESNATNAWVFNDTVSNEGFGGPGSAGCTGGDCNSGQDNTYFGASNYPWQDTIYVRVKARAATFTNTGCASTFTVHVAYE
jgi:hypothetical protein